MTPFPKIFKVRAEDSGCPSFALSELMFRQIEVEVFQLAKCLASNLVGSNLVIIDWVQMLVLA